MRRNPFARLRSVPRPLGLLLGVVAVFGVCWAMLAPPFQSPDAFTHWSYVESLGTRATVPGAVNHGESSSSVAAADRLVGLHEIQWSSPEAKPVWDPGFAARARAQAARLSRSDGGGATPSDAYPPLYYATAVPAYLSTVGGDEFDRLNAVQLWGVLLLLGTTTGAWLLAGEVFGRRRLLQLVTGAVAGLQPMATFISTSVNPDGLLIALWTFVLWMGARVIRRGAPLRDVQWLCGLTAAAILTKQTSYALLPAVGLALWLGRRHRTAPAPAATSDHPPESGGGAILVAGVPGAARMTAAVLERRAVLRAVALACAPVAGWLVIQRSLHHAALSTTPATGSLTRAPGSFLAHFFDYLWQFYLPRLPGQAAVHVPVLGSLPWPHDLGGLPAWNVWIREGWGVFGWVDVYLPAWIYIVLAAITATVAIGGISILARMRDRIRLGLLAYFGAVMVALLAVVHEIEYQMISGGEGSFIQGRYALPLVSLFGLGVSLCISRLPARARGPIAGAAIVALLALQVIALGTVAKAYYT